MKIDWDAFNQLSDEEKVEFLKKVEDAALEEAKGKTFAPGSIAPEKARHQDGFEVVGEMNPDGTIDYYTDDEKPPSREDTNHAGHADDVDEEDRRDG